jgi:hypothetical protein
LDARALAAQARKGCDLTATGGCKVSSSFGLAGIVMA